MGKESSEEVRKEVCLARKSSAVFVSMLFVMSAISVIIGPATTSGEWVEAIPDSPPGSVYDAAVKSSANDGILVNIVVPGMHSRNVTVNTTDFQVLTMPKAGQTTEVGKPQVPMIGVYLEVPYGVDLTLELVHSEQRTLDDYYVYPAQEPAPEFFQPNITPPFVIDTTTYTTDEYYPAVDGYLEGPVVMRGHRVVLVHAYPVRFNPMTEKVVLYSRMEFRVNYDHPAQIEGIAPRLVSPAYESMLEGMILNYKPQSAYKSFAARSGGNRQAAGADYLIITHDDYVQQAQWLADWKERKGLRTHVTKVSDITGGTAADIAAYIEDAYDNWAPPPVYVLLLGDAEFIPPHYGLPHGYHPWASGGDGTATDLYYGAVDGTDMFADVYVGRMSVDNVTDAATMVNKTILYERQPTSNQVFYDNAMVAGFFEENGVYDGTADRVFIDNTERVRQGVMREGYTVERIYDAIMGTGIPPPQNFSDGTPLPAGLQPPYPWDGDANDIISAFNAGRFLVTHRDHGNSQNWYNDAGNQVGTYDGWTHPRFDTTDVPNLANYGDPPLVFSLNCMSGWFDGETDPATFTPSECFAEVLHRHHGGGAIGVVASTRISWSGPNQLLAYGLHDGIWPDFDNVSDSQPLRELGQIFYYGKNYMARNRGLGGVTDITLEEFTLFGDPELSLWTAMPEQLNVSHPNFIGSGGSQRFVVRVGDTSGNPVHNARVVLQMGGTIYAVEDTDPAGYAYFDVTPTAAGTMDITATKDFYVPYTGTITVTAGGAEISITEDVTAPSTTITVTGDNFEAGENVVLSIGGHPLGTATGPSFTETFTVPSVTLGPVNVPARGDSSARVGIDYVGVLDPETDPFVSTHIGDNPDINIYDAGVLVSSGSLVLGTPYEVRVTVHNSAPLPATGTTVSVGYQYLSAGNSLWMDVGDAVIDVPPSPGTALAVIPWNPDRPGHFCLRAEVFHSLDIDPTNNLGQENTDVHPITSPGVIEFTVFNPTDHEALVYIEVEQEIIGGGSGVLWGSRVERDPPQELGPGENQTARLVVTAPDDIETGETRRFQVTTWIDGERTGGIEFTVVKDNRPTLTAGTVTPDPVTSGTTVTYEVTYTDADDHAPMEGWPRVSVFEDGTPVNGSPFTMVEQDPGDTTYSDGKVYELTTVLTKVGGAYSFFFGATDPLGVPANGSLTMMMDGPVVIEAVKNLTVTAPEDDSTFLPGATITVTGTTENVTAGTTVTVTLDGTTVNGTVGADGGWSVDVTAPDTADTYTLSISVDDLTQDVDIVVKEEEVKTLTVTAPADDSVFRPGATITATGTTDNVTAGTLVTVTLDGTTENATVGADGSWSADITAPDAEGTYTLTASVDDLTQDVRIVVKKEEEKEDKGWFGFGKAMDYVIIAIIIIVIIIVAIILFKKMM